MLRFACPKCKTLAEVDDILGGTNYQCPSCGMLMRLAAPATPPSSRIAPPRKSAKPVPRSSPPLLPPQEENLPPETVELADTGDRKARRHVTSFLRCPLVILSGAGVLLLLVVVGLGWWLLSGTGLTNELSYVPDNFDLIASGNVSAVLTSELYTSLKKEIDNSYPNFDRELNKMEKDFGLNHTEVTRATVAVVFPRPDHRSDPEFMIVVKTRKPVELRDLFKSEQLVKFEDTKIGSLTVREYDSSDMVACIPDSKTILFSNHETMFKVLRREKKAAISPGMQEALKKVDFSQAGALAISTTDFWKDMLKNKNVRNSMARDFDNMIDPEKLLLLLEQSVVHVRLGAKVELEAQLLGKESRGSFSVSFKTATLVGLWNKGERPRPPKERERPPDKDRDRFDKE